jgi:hypothetical protein
MTLSIKDTYKHNPALMRSLPKSRKIALAQGMNVYYTGSACHRGHDCIRDAKTGNCFDCITINAAGTRAKKFMKDNPGAVSANSRRKADDLRMQLEIERLSKVSKVKPHARETPCHKCEYVFDHELLGKYGCPNCLGEGLE